MKYILLITLWSVALAGAPAQAATQTTVFPPRTYSNTECPVGATLVLSWTNGGASTNCITGQDVLRLAIPNCGNGQYVAHIGDQYLCKSVPTCDSAQRLNFSGSDFQCEGTDGPPACAANQVLTYNGDHFYCVNRTDSIPNCGANQFLTYNGSFQCSTINTPDVPACGPDEFLISAGGKLECAPAPASRGCRSAQTSSDSSGRDQVTYCPESHPIISSCNPVNDDAPAEPADLSEICPNDGVCSTASPPVQRRGTGGFNIYVEFIKKTIRGKDVQGCLAYTQMHNHRPYSLQIVCCSE